MSSLVQLITKTTDKQMWFCSDRVQTTTFSPLDVSEMFLAPTCRPDDSSLSPSLPVLPSPGAWRPTLLLRLWGGFWDAQSSSVVSELLAMGAGWLWSWWKNSQNSSCRSGWRLRRDEIWEQREMKMRFVIAVGLQCWTKRRQRRLQRHGFPRRLTSMFPFFL